MCDFEWRLPYSNAQVEKMCFGLVHQHPSEKSANTGFDGSHSFSELDYEYQFLLFRCQLGGKQASPPFQPPAHSSPLAVVILRTLMKSAHIHEEHPLNLLHSSLATIICFTTSKLGSLILPNILRTSNIIIY